MKIDNSIKELMSFALICLTAGITYFITKNVHIFLLIISIGWIILNIVSDFKNCNINLIVFLISNTFYLGHLSLIANNSLYIIMGLIILWLGLIDFLVKRIELFKYFKIALYDLFFLISFSLAFSLLYTNYPGIGTNIILISIGLRIVIYLFVFFQESNIMNWIAYWVEQIWIKDFNKLYENSAELQIKANEANYKADEEVIKKIRKEFWMTKRKLLKNKIPMFPFIWVSLIMFYISILSLLV